jgi:hypothetical protein
LYGIFLAEQNSVGEVQLTEVVCEACTEAVTTAPTLGVTEGSITNRAPRILSNSLSVKEQRLKPNPSVDHHRTEDEKMLLKKTTDPRPRKKPISSHQWPAATALSASNASSITAQVLPFRNAESKPVQGSTRQTHQPIRKVPLNSSPLGRGDLSISSRIYVSHVRSEVLMRSPSYKGNTASKSVLVQDKALSVSLTGPILVAATVIAFANLPASPARTRLESVGEEILLSAQVDGDVGTIVESTKLLDRQFLQFESDGEEDW